VHNLDPKIQTRFGSEILGSEKTLSEKNCLNNFKFLSVPQTKTKKILTYAHDIKNLL
jgi:hypothetical protein